MSLANVRITCDDPSGSPKHYRVFLDDVEISRYVRGISFDVDIHHVAVVKLSLVARVDMPENIKALVSGEIEEP